jgi:hypothetical protein
MENGKMNIKIFVLAAYTAMCLFTCRLYADVVFEPAALELGNVEKGALVHRRVGVYNTAGEPVRINRVYGDCGCLSFSQASISIPPFGQTEIIVKYNSSGDRPGRFLKTVFVSLSTGDRKLEVTGEIVAPKQAPDLKPSAPKTKIKALGNTGQQPGIAHRNPIYAAYFYSPRCNECLHAGKILDAVFSAHPDISLKKFDISVRENRLLIESMAMIFSVPESAAIAPPVVFASGPAGTAVFQGKDITEKNIYRFLAAPAAVSGIRFNTPPWETAKCLTSNAEEKIKHRFGTLSMAPIILAALVDGINPCAFGAIVFFVMYLSVVMKKPKSEILVTGIGFVAGVFLAYFLIGLGITALISTVRAIGAVSRTFYFMIAAVALVLSALSFVDYFTALRAGKGGSSKLILKLPGFLRARIYAVIEKYAGSRYIAVFSFAVGLLISLLEFFCTGQVYLPTITYMVGLPDFRGRAIAYLIAYCAAFVLPLVCVFILVFFGIKSEKLEALARRSVPAAKFLTGIVFLCFAVLIFLVAK